MYNIWTNSVWIKVKNASKFWCFTKFRLSEISPSVFGWFLVFHYFYQLLTSNSWRITLWCSWSICRGYVCLQFRLWMGQIESMDQKLWSIKLGTNSWKTCNLEKFYVFFKFTPSTSYLQIIDLCVKMHQWTIYSWNIGHEEHFGWKSQTLTFRFRRK